jgi:hypothetical protein
MMTQTEILFTQEASSPETQKIMLYRDLITFKYVLYGR